MNFDKLKFPHIKYISEIQSKSKEERTLYYLGGEPEENDSRLTIYKEYELRTASYSPSSDVYRVSVWICSDDEDKGKKKKKRKEILRMDREVLINKLMKKSSTSFSLVLP